MNSEYFPDSLPAKKLDEYLSVGWYRMEQSLFTLDYIFIEKWIRVFWLRYRMEDFQFSRKHRQLMNRCSAFSVETKPLQITEEHESLFSLYRQIIDFDGPPSASRFLFGRSFDGNKPKNVFDSQMIEVRHQNQLIAVGVFDVGENAVAGILNFYHPDFKKYSFGKFLILKKMEFVLNSGREFYYPGYIGFDFPKFDYKLFPGSQTAEIWDPFDFVWLPYSPELVAHLTQMQELFFVSTSTDTDKEDIDFPDN